MGNREALLAGAKKCLLEKGYARTTVRDIASAAGVSTAAIGYHFGSREKLLNLATFAAMDDWGDEVGRTFAQAVTPGASPATQFLTIWERLIFSYQKEPLLWAATIEASQLAKDNQELHDQLAAGQAEGKRGITALVQGIPESEVADEDVETIGGVMMALIPGVMQQWLLNPQDAPRGPEIARGLRRLADLITPPE